MLEAILSPRRVTSIRGEPHIMGFDLKDSACLTFFEDDITMTVIVTPSNGILALITNRTHLENPITSQ
ncbi:hypothetical protein J6590_056085 [Homalodisca vitripennis]|nr:hypothetical protein J6590_056085 [Homalodisca vitripennis]